MVIELQFTGHRSPWILSIDLQSRFKQVLHDRLASYEDVGVISLHARFVLFSSFNRVMHSLFLRQTCWILYWKIYAIAIHKLGIKFAERSVFSVIGHV
jgi:hypothetical protein